MPTYEYLCHNTSCHHEFETFQSMKDDALVQCPACSKPTLKRKIGLGAGIIFKGSGFYETDYRRKGNGTEAKKDAPAATAGTTQTPEASKPATASSTSTQSA
jgi:putative FmdB family regulatory protein